MAKIKLPLPTDTVISVTDKRKIAWTPIPTTEFPYMWQAAPCSKCGITADSRTLEWSTLLFQYGPLDEVLPV